MRLLTILVALAFAAAAFAQYSAPVTTAAATTTTMTTVSTQPVTAAGVTCPPGTATLNGPCAAMLAEGPIPVGQPTILILSSEERYALDNMPLTVVAYERFPVAYLSLTSVGNPITHSYPTGFLTRHGNPFFPYFQAATVSSRQKVAGTIERLMTSGAYPSSLNANERSTLDNIRARWRSLTPQQALAMGYQPTGTFIAGVGQPYINMRLVDNVYDPMMPEAFTFSSGGQLLAVQYILNSPAPVSAYGQVFQSSPLVQGAQQLSIWLFRANPNGMFAPTAPTSVTQ